VVRALKVSPAGTRVYVGGDFTAVGGAARARVAALSPSSGGAFGGEFTQAGGEAHQGLAQFSGTP
jgi:hypothetical protein